MNKIRRSLYITFLSFVGAALLGIFTQSFFAQPVYAQIGGSCNGGGVCISANCLQCVGGICQGMACGSPSCPCPPTATPPPQNCTSGSCMIGPVCPQGYQGAGGSCSGVLNGGICCIQSPPTPVTHICDSGVVCQNCPNTCATNFQVGCNYTSYSGGGSCTQTAAPLKQCPATISCVAPQFCGSGGSCIGGGGGPTNTPVPGATNTPTTPPGSTNTPVPPTPTTPPSGPVCTAPVADIEGFYSADKNFIINGYNDGCATTDLRLGVEGAIIVNAGQPPAPTPAGTFQMNRSLCAGNADTPVFTIKERPDLILNAPDSFKTTNFLYTEVAP